MNKIEVKRHYFLVSPEFSLENKNRILRLATGLTKGNHISFVAPYIEEITALKEYFKSRGLECWREEIHDITTDVIDVFESGPNRITYLVMSEADYDLIEELYQEFTRTYEGIITFTDPTGLHGL